MLELAFQAGGVAIQLVTSPTVQKTVQDSYTAISNYFYWLTSSPDIFKEKEINLDQEHFNQLTTAINNFNAKSGDELSINSYSLEAIASKLRPESLNNRYTLRSDISEKQTDGKETYSLISFIIEASEEFLTRSDTTPVQRDIFISEINKFLNYLKPIKFQLTNDDYASLVALRMLRNDKELFPSLDNFEIINTEKPALIENNSRILNNERFCAILQSFTALYFKSDSIPAVPGNYLKSVWRPNVLEYLSSIHPDTANNIYLLNIEGKNIPSTILTAVLLMTYTLLKDDNKTQLQAKNIHCVFGQFVDGCLKKGVRPSPFDGKILEKINQHLGKYTNIKPPLAIKFEKEILSEKKEEIKKVLTDVSSAIDEAQNLRNSSTIAGVTMQEVEKVSDINKAEEVARKTIELNLANTEKFKNKKRQPQTGTNQR